MRGNCSHCPQPRILAFPVLGHRLPSGSAALLKSACVCVCVCVCTRVQEEGKYLLWKGSRYWNLGSTGKIWDPGTEVQGLVRYTAR